MHSLIPPMLHTRPSSEAGTVGSSVAPVPTLSHFSQLRNHKINRNIEERMSSSGMWRHVDLV
jgi:hypothetical protein